MNPQKLLEQFLGPNVLGGTMGGLAQGSKGQQFDDRQASGGAGVGDLIGKALGGLGAAGGGLGGVAAGGLIGVMLGNKSIRKMAGGMLGYGGAAALGALAYRAFQNWQAGQQAGQAPLATIDDAPGEGARFAPAYGADGKPFALALIRAMIAAANADGHVGAEEQKQIFEAANRAGLDAEDKAFVFDALQNPSSPAQLAALAGGQEQAAEIYLAARIAIDVDHPAEKAFLETLARSLRLPDALIGHLDAQVTRSFSV